MKLKALLETDKNLNWIQNQGADEATLGEIEIDRLCDLKNLSSDGTCFVKSKAFFLELGEKLKLENSIGPKLMLLKAGLWEKVDEQLQTLVLNQIAFIAEASDIELLITNWSRPFYYDQLDRENDIADGRQMGTCEIDSTAWIAQGVQIGSRVKIGPHCRIYSGAVIMSDCEIEEGTVIYPRVTLYPKTRIGPDCRIHSGVVIGSDGFGHEFREGEHKKIWHLGGVTIGKNVEIGANTTIDRGTFSDTVIRDGAKIDNLVQIGHNCDVGRGAILCGQVGLAGSVTIGEFSVLGGAAKCAPGITLGAQCQVAGFAALNCSWPEKMVLGGHPARPFKEWLKTTAYLRKEALRPKK